MSQLELVEQDRDAAFALLKLHVSGHRYVEGCNSNGGIACYCCRTVEWLEAHSDYRHTSPMAGSGVTTLSVRKAKDPAP